MRSTREKIMVLLAALAVLYGAYTLLLGSRRSASSGAGKVAAPANAESPAWIDEIQTHLRGAVITPLQEKVVSRALEPWRDDLILAAALPQELFDEEQQRLVAVRKAAEEAERARKDKLAEAERRQRQLLDLRKRFVYSGYVWRPAEGGGEFCAVINGISYRKGEEIEGGGHVVKSISAEAVVIVSVEQGFELTIPITE